MMKVPVQVNEIEKAVNEVQSMGLEGVVATELWMNEFQPTRQGFEKNYGKLVAIYTRREEGNTYDFQCIMRDYHFDDAD